MTVHGIHMGNIPRSIETIRDKKCGWASRCAAAEDLAASRAPFERIKKEILDEKDLELTLLSIMAISAQSGKEAAGLLIKAAGHHAAPVREQAIKKITLIADRDRAVALLIKALRDKNLHVRIAAAAALGTTGDAKAAKPLLALVKSGEPWQLKYCAIEALGNLRAREAVNELIKVFQTDRRYLKLVSAWALGKIMDRSAIEPLLENLGDEKNVTDYWSCYPYLREYIAAALWSITGKDFGDKKDEWRKWWDANRKTIPAGDR